MKEEQADFNIYKLSEAGVGDSPLNVKRFSFDNDDEYGTVLEGAQSEGVACLIEGNEPSDDEMQQIKSIFDQHGRVKIFRKRKNDLSQKFVIHPSEFRRIGEQDEGDERLKESVCRHITDLIDLSYST